MTYNYYGKDRIRNTGFRDNLTFSWDHIKRLYLLHIVTTLAMAVGLFIRDRELPVLTRNILLDVFLIQEWFPLAGRSVNDVSWYLCVTVFLYFIFPWILNALDRLEDPKKAFVQIVKLCFGSVTFAAIGGGDRMVTARGNYICEYRPYKVV